LAAQEKKRQIIEKDKLKQIIRKSDDMYEVDGY